MISKLLSAYGAFCVATVITQTILLGYFLAQGTINEHTLTKVVALFNGIDISGDRLQQILRESEDREQPDFEEILDARKMESLDMDMRRRSQDEYREAQTKREAALRLEEERLDSISQAFDRRLEETMQGAQEEGMRELQRIVQSFDAVQAKEQLLIMYEDERIDVVVNIVQAMSTEKRKDILAEFVSEDEKDKLAEILRRIGEGTSTMSLINQARAGS